MYILGRTASQIYERFMETKKWELSVRTFPFLFLSKH
nr:MAG TPA: protein of unknown function (DUF5338) [Caudoviricetes sp.]